MRFYCTLFSLLCAVGMSDSENILFLLFPDTGSHFQSAKPIFNVLLEAGHNVTVVLSSKMKFNVERVNIINALLNNGSNVDSELFWQITTSAALLPLIYEIADVQTNILIDKHPVKLRQLFNEWWDLIIIDDLFTTYGYGFALMRRQLLSKHGRAAPFILLSTAGGQLNFASLVQAVGRNWASAAPMFLWLPADETDFFNARRFTHRAISLYENTLEFITMNIYSRHFQINGLRRLGAVKDFSWEALYAQSSWIFMERLDWFGWPLSQGAEEVNIGVRCKQSTQNELPSELTTFINDPMSIGTIYVALGSYANLDVAPRQVLDAFIGAFNRLSNYRIILAASTGANSKTRVRLNRKFGAHVRLLSWAPQTQILAHPSTRLFITHAGLKSLKEGLCSTVPLVLMPMFAEQAYNAHTAAIRGVGPIINKYLLNSDLMHNAILKVLDDYIHRKQRAERLRHIFVDRPLSAADAVRFHVERIFRRQRRFGGTHGERVTFTRGAQQLHSLTMMYADVLVSLFTLILMLNWK